MINFFYYDLWIYLTTHVTILQRPILWSCFNYTRFLTCFLIFLIFIYLAVAGLSCSMQTLSCGMWDLVPWLETELRSPGLEAWSQPLDHQESPISYVLRLGRLPWWLRWERIHLQCRRPGFDLQVGKIPWRRAWQPLHYSSLENPHGQRSPVGYSPRGHKESDMIEWLRTAQHSTGILHRVFLVQYIHESSCSFSFLNELLKQPV